MTLAQLAREAVELPAVDRSLLDVDEVVAVGVGLGEFDHWVIWLSGHFLQKASKCQPKRRTSERGRALNVPTKTPLYKAPFQPPCRRERTGKRSGTIRT